MRCGVGWSGEGSGAVLKEGDWDAGFSAREYLDFHYPGDGQLHPTTTPQHLLLFCEFAGWQWQGFPADTQSTPPSSPPLLPQVAYYCRALSFSPLS